jgi:hypothetical protein
MRIVVEHRVRQILPGDFEALPGVTAPEIQVSTIRWHPTSPVFANSGLMRVNSRPAIWDSTTGKLLWVPDHATDLGWSPDGQSVYVLRHGRRLARYTWPDLQLAEEIDAGGSDGLAICPTGDRAAVIFIQSPEWFYSLITLRPAVARSQASYQIDGYLMDGPVFSPDGRHVVVVSSPRYLWWTDAEDPEDWLQPSSGGLHEVGWIHVHDLEAERRTTHTLVMDLPAGWTPEARAGDADEWPWTVLWGPEFTSPDTFRVWLPGGNPVDLTLPLPTSVEVPSIPPTWREDDRDLA